MIEKEEKKYSDDDFLSTIEAAELLNVSRTTLNYWIRNYSLPCEKTPGGRYKIRYIDLKKFLALHNQQNRTKLRRKSTKYKIAIIEPNQETKKIYNDWLAEYYGVKLINNIEKPIKELINFNPDIIIMEADLKSNTTDGFNILDLIKAEHELNQKLIIFISNKYDEDDVVRALENGACEYVRKPIGQTELNARVKSVLRYFVNI